MIALTSRRIVVLILGFCLSFRAVGANNISIIVDPPLIKGNTSFAIFVDSTTFVNVGEPILKYRKSIEHDHLPTYIIIANWERPEQIRDIIIELYQQTNYKLEGFVLIGDIPIVMMQDAQHFTSAFRIDQNQFSNKKISVPTDRYYDDLDLQCEFLYQDSIHTNLNYFKLLPSSPARIQRELYSARITIPHTALNKYKLMKYLFKKLVRIKNSPLEPLDYITSAYGFNYISDSYTAIVDEHLTMHQAFEFGQSPGNRIETIFHRVHSHPKQRIMRKLSASGLDLFILHSHGDEKTQFIQENSKRPVRADTLTCSQEVSNTLTLDKTAITINDLETMKITSQVIFLDVCYNGAFHLDTNMATQYLYSRGNAITVLANSVNVRQDISFVENIGALRYGIRIGKWHQLEPYLESHLFGDPTHHFANSKPNNFKYAVPFELCQDCEHSINYFESIFKKSKIPYFRASALGALHRLGAKNISKYITKALTDPANIVRLKAWLLLASDRSQTFIKLLPATLDDSYELIRRYGVIWMGEVGNSSFVQHLARASVDDPSERVVFNALISLKLIGGQEAITAFKWILSRLNDFDDGKFIQQARANLFTITQWLPNEVLPQITHGENEQKIQCIKLFRGNHHLMALPTLIFAFTNDADPHVRAATAEALGWYSFYEKRDIIVSALDKKLTQPDSSQIVLDAIALAKGRLMNGPNKSNAP